MLTRLLKFNAVGIAGAGVQLAALWIYARAGIPDLWATLLAVETAVLHNFVWHEVWTWRGIGSLGRRRRLFRFQIANGLLSIASNVLLTWILRNYLPLVAANAVAIGLTAVLNFLLAQFWVFRGAATPIPGCSRLEAASSGCGGRAD
jgi:putative flippase GtrA